MQFSISPSRSLCLGRHATFSLASGLVDHVAIFFLQLGVAFASATSSSRFREDDVGAAKGSLGEGGSNFHLPNEHLARENGFCSYAMAFSRLRAGLGWWARRFGAGFRRSPEGRCSQVSLADLPQAVKNFLQL